MTHKRILAATAILLFGATAASAQRGRDDRPDKPVPPGQEKRMSPQEQQQRIDEQRKRDTDYQQRLNQQVRDAQAHAAELQNQKRTAQLAAHQQYLQNLQQQQQRLQTQRDYSRDPAFSTPPSFRYRLSGSYHQTNQYGADMLRQAVNDGYQQGVIAGRADRADRRRSNYQETYGYRDANYGYSGAYVPQSDYNYYFRQGFQRGYEDGYASRYQYGTVSNGSTSILGDILTSILGLQPIR